MFKFEEVALNDFKLKFDDCMFSFIGSGFVYKTAFIFATDKIKTLSEFYFQLKGNTLGIYARVSMK